MQEIVRQLGELFLQAVPTVLIILLFYFILRAIFFKPLLAVMAERDARTVGAQKAAEAAQAAAIEKIKQYQDALKQARGQVYAEQEAARKKVLDERAAVIKEARATATAQVTAGKERIAHELAAARREIEATVAQLSAEIARRILQSPPRPGGSAREAR
jgi:F0F1-type ATP synthase membrane subunit b/b'